MADIVLGLTKSVVEGMLSKVQSAIEEEAKLKVRVQHDLVFITGEFQMMQSFLKAVDREQVKDSVVRTWVKQLRDLAYDVEDCIEFVIHVDEKLIWWRCLLPSCMVASPPLDQAVSDVNQLKARVEDVSKRNMRYNLISDSSSSKPATTQQQPSTISGTTEFDMLIEARDTARNHCGLCDLTKLISKDDKDLQVISVWGTGSNLGTTSIIRKAFEDPEICQKFRFRGWVKLVYPFDPYKVIWSLLSEFIRNSYRQRGGNVNVEAMLSEAEAVADMQGGHVRNFINRVQNNRYLIVLEDLPTMVEWDAIRTYLPDMKNGSRIIVSTQQLEIASLCTGHPHQVSELEKISDDHSVCVFFKEGSQSDEDGKNTMMMASNDQTPVSKRTEALNWVERFQPVGRKMEKSDLSFMLCQAANIGRKKVISVWGIAGVGKSALVKMVYYGEIDKYDRFNKYGWVNVCRPFNLRDFSRSLLSDLNRESLQANGTSDFGTMGIKDPIEECSNLMKKNKCLVVIDGLQSMEEWDLIKVALANVPSKSCVVVITDEADVATHCAVPDDAVFNVKGLEADEALELFIREVYRETETLIDPDAVKQAKQYPDVMEQAKQDPDIMEQANLILNKCGGLPQVIVAVGRYLATKKNMELWSNLNDSFIYQLEISPGLDSLRGLFTWMHSYFHSCPDSLKPCVFYLSIFPRDRCIRRKRLVRRWITEGYSRDTDISTADTEAEDSFSKLVSLSIIQDPSKAATEIYRSKGMRIALCQVNGFIREYIVSRPMEDNLVFALEGRCSLNSQRTGRHLAIRSTWNRDINVFKSMDFSRLRSLTVFGKWEPFFISDTMRLVRVLDLEDTSDLTNNDLEEIGKLLPRLKFLSLRGCREISHLPSSIGGLRQLQTLDVRHTSIGRLPPAIIKLRKLQYIRAGGIMPLSDGNGMVAKEESSTPPRNMPRTKLSWLSQFRRHRPVGSVKVPIRIGKLTNLHTLGVVNVNVAGGKAILEELKKLTQLRKLGVSGINHKNSQKFCKAISGHSHLESLSVWIKGNHTCLDGIYPHPENLQSLKLYGLADKLPVWIKQLNNLTKMNLEMTILGREDIEVLGDLPNLVMLQLFVKPVQNGQLCFHPKPEKSDSSVFVSLHVLEIACNSSLHVRFIKLAMPHLEMLKVRCCSGSSLQFSGLENLYCLKEVSLEGSYDIELKEDLLQQLDKLPKSNKPVLTWPVTSK
ncbi:putative disease resistance RPP13-like protein 2 isoform X2 [Brachypodium distachyon]|uniref:Disease resistance protein RPM1 n=1 Tax=Brachypodium distachyon TaxID=15368 RepID=I1ITB4_BRADI|nr:putative disease resistance RPP13-like protein 2 isoform X2 [Brachypodium distachyon]XP_024319331.1 putative disease resistance RPP13-like protein 2 isoform X2 [Brachypodium distachyon]KQJ91713.1 hypothetical protein BRADI_4g39317v3 [Brachypodium distachyon]KQJ91714.1 hypothetical protein BRADI_4g39317v3 [Brachypodium distachyon]KQJ91715.1 hypothetical protein BRADI_4g39317v3 [Brachypodium distachyon]KQJ91716.1 hypothetical protein BRADI_4g39317v3 [Brachypodium distachyon]PNT65253.1 hypoth|eukprot:XP_024319330.1 putative disease resistance RPP13-like protein 2 isoform X2 [Brachypodium distachyon]